MSEGNITHEPKPEGDVEQPLSGSGNHSSGNTSGSSSDLVPTSPFDGPAAAPTNTNDKNPDEFCGVPKRKACCLIFLTVLIVAIIGVTVGLVVANHQNKEEVEPLPSWYQPPPPVVLVASPQRRLDLIRQAVQAHPLLASQASALPATASDLPASSSDNTLLKAAHWAVHEDSIQDQFDIPLRFGLAAVYFDMEGDLWTTKTNWLSEESSHCDWHGISCCNGARGVSSPHCRRIDNLHNTTVTEIDISENNVGGSTSPYFVLFQDMYALAMAFNRITGPIPNEVVKGSPALHILEVQHNQLSGPIPDDLLVEEEGSLDTLFINDNPGLTGAFPREYCAGAQNKFFHLKLDCRSNQCFCCIQDECIDANPPLENDGAA